MNNWKAIRPQKDAAFELYDLDSDIEERDNVAALHPAILEQMVAYAKQAHTPPRTGKVLDPSLGFKGHKK